MMPPMLTHVRSRALRTLPKIAWLALLFLVGHFSAHAQEVANIAEESQAKAKRAQVEDAASSEEGRGHLVLGADSPRVGVDLPGERAFRVGGYIETFYSWNFNQPGNQITEFRAFDNRHNSISLQALALDLSWHSPTIVAQVVVQSGLGPATYYAASEAKSQGTALSAASTPEMWQHVQQAWIGWMPGQRKLTFEMGHFLSSIGPENMATYQNFHWSHSILYFGLPFYHLGARARWKINHRQSLQAGVYNGWNSAVDTNRGKSIGLDYRYAHRDINFGASYFGGSERPKGAAEGPAWRHLFDVSARWNHGRFGALSQANAGVEPNRFGLSSWAALNLSSRLQLPGKVAFAARASGFYEHRARGNDGEFAAAITIPSKYIGSATLTSEWAPIRGFVCRLEGRYDRAAPATYFGRDVQGSGSEDDPFIPSRRDQLTLTLGVSAWF
jgi:hypothetical protein